MTITNYSFIRFTCHRGITKHRRHTEAMQKFTNNESVVQPLFAMCSWEKRWKMQIQAGKKVNKITTVLDEAFVLLLLENIWSDMEKVNIDDYYRPKKEKKKQ